MKYIKYLIFLLILGNSCTKDSTKTLLFVGSFTEGIASTGIYIYELDTKTGEFIELRTKPH